MKVVSFLSEWKKIRSNIKSDQTIGFVATMGCLHAGHMDLVRQAREANDVVVMSIFVNPTQFNNSDDLKHYPRTFEQDKVMAEQAGVDYILAPDAEAMYPDEAAYKIIEQDSDQRLEGLHRPGHFAGALTIVMKLLLLIRPSKAYFGEKDYEQLRLVRGMANAFLLDTEVIGCPIVREKNGLAMSSRNERLSLDQQEKASQLFAYLSSSLSCEAIKSSLEKEGFSVEYVEEHWGRRFIAAWFNGVRLIDNVKINEV